uniref:Uncharacterized protein n=1 Tax=Lepeophtheirus salmonis TaxID=72036 RepID=A0A0K2UZQ6_LEPSM
MRTTLVISHYISTYVENSNYSSNLNR